MNPLRIASIVAINLVLTVVTASLVGPSASKLAEQFGLVAWAARTPFYLVPLLLTPLTLWFKPKLSQGVTAGFFLAIPLAFWAKAAACSWLVQITYIASACLQGWLLSWLASGPKRRNDLSDKEI